MAALLLLLLLATASAFAPTPPFHHATARLTSSLLASSSSSVEQDEISSILRPKYEIEPIALRIGHGFVRFYMIYIFVAYSILHFFFLI
jgi:hypothetical protein